MSGETKYTPGPWHVGLVDETSVLSADRETVALCCDRYEDDPERKAADARLIAAAPDLVEALDGPDPDAPECIKPLSWLHSMVAHCKARGPAPDDDDPAAFHDMIGEVEALYVRARAALSKALGEGQDSNG